MTIWKEQRKCRYMITQLEITLLQSTLIRQMTQKIMKQILKVFIGILFLMILEGYNILTMSIPKFESQKVENTIIIDMKNGQFPFGCFQNPTSKLANKKIFVRKEYNYRGEKQKQSLVDRANILKEMYHRNIINLRSIEEKDSSLSICYHYVHHSIQSAFPSLSQSAFKQLHKQLIQLAIHLAKNYLLASFNPARCGIIFIDQKFIVKYFLPLHEIAVTQDRAALQRSVQLFKVQAMHFLDNLRHHDVLSQLSTHSSKEVLSFKSGNERDIPQLQTRKQRRLSNQTLKLRKLSNSPNITRKRSHDSNTTNQTSLKISGLKSTLNTFRLRSQRKRTSQRSNQKIKQRVQFLKARSQRAMTMFRLIQVQLERWRALSRVIRLCNEL